MSVLQLQVKLQNTAKKTYLEEKKTQRRYHLTHLDLSNSKKTHNLCFERKKKHEGQTLRF